jgi:hypothetical protein
MNLISNGALWQGNRFFNVVWAFTRKFVDIRDVCGRMPTPRFLECQKRQLPCPGCRVSKLQKDMSVIAAVNRINFASRGRTRNRNVRNDRSSRSTPRSNPRGFLLRPILLR